MDLKLTGTDLEPIVAKAIVDMLTPEKRDELIRNAVENLITKRDPYNTGQKKSELQQAFDRAVGRIADKMVEEKLTNDSAIMAELEKLLAEGWQLMLQDENRKKIVENISGALRRAITGDRY